MDDNIKDNVLYRQLMIINVIYIFIKKDYHDFSSSKNNIISNKINLYTHNNDICTVILFNL